MNYSTERISGQQITANERHKIEALNKAKISIKEISVQIGVNYSTILRELRRGMTSQVKSSVEVLNNDGVFVKEKSYCKIYTADYGQFQHESNSSAKGKSIKLGKDYAFCKYIEDLIIKGKYSPAAALSQIKLDGKTFATNICVKTLYNYIDKNYFAKLTNKELPEQGRCKKHEYKRVRVANNNRNGTSIEQRPKKVDEKVEQGHWEGDLIVGAQGTKEVLFTLTERVNKREIIMKLKDKTQASVIAALNQLERKYGHKFKKIFKTITFDNGSEFLDMAAMEKSIFTKKPRTKLYYAHSYCSWERGANENMNRMIRRFIPKGTDIGKWSDKQIKEIEDWLNNYPRKMLNGSTPNLTQTLFAQKPLGGNKASTPPTPLSLINTPYPNNQNTNKL